jgi:hypothetical protein
MDIVVTIPKSEYENDNLETLHMEQDESLVQFWTLSGVPKALKIGDRVYFVKNKRIESSMLVIEVKVDGQSIVCETTGRGWKGACQIFMNDLREENFDFEIKGFQGFRYLQTILNSIS